MAKGIIISGGNGGDTSDDCTATNNQVLEGYTAITKGSDDEAVAGTMKNLSNRATITHTSSNGTKVILGDAAFLATNSDGAVRSSVRYNGGEGYITNNTLIAIDASVMATAGGLTSAKLMSGQSSFGLSGTATSDATASAAQILSGYTAYKNGSKITGTMANYGAVSQSLAINGTYTIPAGYHNGSGKVTQSISTLGAQTITPNTATQTVSSSGKYLTGNITVNPIPSNYLNVSNNATVFNSGSYGMVADLGAYHTYAASTTSVPTYQGETVVVSNGLMQVVIKTGTPSGSQILVDRNAVVFRRCIDLSLWSKVQITYYYASSLVSSQLYLASPYYAFTLAAISSGSALAGSAALPVATTSTTATFNITKLSTATGSQCWGFRFNNTNVMRIVYVSNITLIK
ncbi:MAG: hypothetical protein ACRDBO_02660 [Lachnospiraceae bacterium]